MAKKQRVDEILVARGLAADLDEARRRVMAGKVLANGQRVFQASQQIPIDGELGLVPDAPFVSRGGEKLQAALREFPISVEGAICADVGASTGGFTDCLLQGGASRVYAIDVGYGILDWRMRKDPRVIVMERTNARNLETLPELIDFATADVSFISLKKVFPALAGWFKEGMGEAVFLVKPQFEATKEEAARGAGVITDPEIQKRVLQEVLEFIEGKGFSVRGIMPSPLLGPSGNREFLAWISRPVKEIEGDNLQKRIRALF